jgi:hypothetical protein
MVLFSLLFSASAKSLMPRENAKSRSAASHFLANGYSAAGIQNFESALTPYLSARISNTVSSAAVYAPSQADYLTLAKYWSHFSPNFMDLYAKAVQIPPNLLIHNSPGGHFQIIYSISGEDSVDITDTIGYSTSNWRIRQQTGNGVPDYVELVAYAADSSWSMEIDRFGFVQPFPYINNGYTSSQFKIYVRHASDPRDYALTFPDGKMPGTIGFRSHIEIRNEWNSFGSDYAVHPEKAIQVTCAHEFFHTIQYAMTRQIVLNFIPEDFPVSWVEGTAVLMEDCGFNYVYDYQQYLDSYFMDPASQVLEPLDGYGNDDGRYKNSIVAMYLYQFAADSSCICFIKDMFFNDYRSPVAFVSNLRSTAAQYGRVWTEMLGRFHTGSYYTGSRAVPGRFIKDAGLIKNQWFYNSDGLSSGQSITKPVQPFALNTFSFLHQTGNSDTLQIGFLGDSLKHGETDTNAIWSAHCILKKDNTPANDSVFAIPISTICHGRATIDGWHRFKEALVIATNGRYDMTRNATVVFEACSTTVLKGETARYYAVSGGSSDAQNALVTVSANTDLSCAFSIAKTTITRELSDSATKAHLAPAGLFFNLSFPFSWLNDATMDLAVSEPLDSIHFSPGTSTISDTLLSLYRWDNSLLQWDSIPGSVSRQANSILVFRCPVVSSGIIGLFGPLQTTASNNIIAYPNPARIKSTGTVTFSGTDIIEIWIYTIDGFLLSHAAKGASVDQSFHEAPNGFFSWLLRSNRGKPVSPGVYYASIGYKDVMTKGMKKKLQKIFVIP